MIKGRIVSSIDLMCAPDKGDDALVMGVDRELVSIPSTRVVVSESESYLSPLVETVFKVKPTGTLGLTDITADVHMTLRPFTTAYVRCALRSGVLTVTVQQPIHLTEEPQIAAKVKLTYTPEGGEAVTRDVDIYIVGDASLQPLKDEIDRKPNTSDIPTLSGTTIRFPGADIVIPSRVSDLDGSATLATTADVTHDAIVGKLKEDTFLGFDLTTTTADGETAEGFFSGSLATTSQKWFSLTDEALDIRKRTPPEGLVYNPIYDCRYVHIDSDGIEVQKKQEQGAQSLNGRYRVSIEGDTVQVTQEGHGVTITPDDVIVTDTDGNEISLIDLAARVEALENR